MFKIIIYNFNSELLAVINLKFVMYAVGRTGRMFCFIMIVDML